MANIDGSSFVDDLPGTIDADLIRAFGQDDLIAPNGGGDDVFGGAGTDTVTYDTALFAANFDTTILLNLQTAARSANIAGSSFDDVERFIFPGSTTFVTGGSAVDVELTGGASTSNNITGGITANQFLGGDGDDTFTGLGGDDLLETAGGANLLDGGEGNDTLTIDADLTVTEVSTLFGGAGEDILTGGAQSFGQNGNDDISFLNATSGLSDVALFGGLGDDTIAYDSNAEASLFGGGGADRLSVRGEGQLIHLDGGGGNDFYTLHTEAVVEEDQTFSAGGGIDTVRVYFDNYVQPTNVELVRITQISDAQNYSATGNDAPGTLVGNAGNNTLIARGGNDQVNGNGGDDTLIGNTGVDTLVGGEGADTFVYTAIADSRAGVEARDVINGFDRGADLIDLTAIDADTTSFGTDDAFAFVGTNSFSNTAGELRLQGLGGADALLVEADHNGDGVADFQILVTRTTDLDAADFLL